MTGTYNGSSVALPGTTAVASGRPSGARAPAAIFSWGRFGVVLAVAELQEPLLGQDLGVGVGGGGVDADQVGGELVDADGLLVRVMLQGAEGVTDAEPSEPVSEPIVVGTGGPDVLAQQGGEGAVVLGDP